MIDAVEVVEVGHPPRAAGDPRVALPRHHVPPVDREAPVLAGRAEGVGRDAHPRVEAEVAAPGPHVGGVRRHHEREVAPELDAERARGGAGAAPLLLGLPLEPGEEQDLAREPSARVGERVRIAVAQRLRPVRPGAPTQLAVVQRHEERVVVEPGPLLLDEGHEGAGPLGLPLHSSRRKRSKPSWKARRLSAGPRPSGRRSTADRGQAVALLGGERVDAARLLEVGHRLGGDVHRVDGEGRQGEVRAVLAARGLVDREEQDRGQPGVPGPARERDQVRDLAHPPVGGGAEGEERDEDACLP